MFFSRAYVFLFPLPFFVQESLSDALLNYSQTVGNFEYEFQAATADELTVTQNTSPGAPPTGFEALEPNSFIIDLKQSKGAGLTLSKIDYIFDTASTLLNNFLWGESDW